MKRSLFAISLALVILLCSSTVYASPLPYADSQLPYHVETIITDSQPFSLNQPLATTGNTITKTKTTKVLADDRSLLWSVSITATFTYDGQSAHCVSYTPNATAYASNWSIKSVTASKSGASATANAVALHKIGSTSQEYSKSVTISCTKDGTVY